MPRTHGDSFIPYSIFDRVYEEERPIFEHLAHPQTEITRKIGKLISEIVEDQSCLQLGIGAIPDAALCPAIFPAIHKKPTP